MKELKEKLIFLLGEKFSLYGFKFRSSTRSFVKNIPGGRVSFHLALINYAFDFDVKADVAIRFDELQDMIYADSNLTRRESMQTYSMGAEIGNMTCDESKRWKISSEADVANAVSGLINAFESYALPFYEKYSSIPEAFMLLSKNDQTASLYSPFPDWRAKRVLGLAILLGHKDLTRLVKESADFLREIDSDGLEGYLDFAKKNLPQ